jgi:AP-2 complex subunit mu-1
MKTFLSGMPECKFGMNDKLVMEKENQNKDGGRKRQVNNGIAIDDVSFHRCVSLSQYDNDRTISFIPPDGDFTLMKYRITERVNLPFRVVPVVTPCGRTKVEYEIKINGNFSNKLWASNVKIKIPTPLNTAKTTQEVGIGYAKYKPQENAIVWKIKKFPGDESHVLRGEARLAAGIEDKVWSRPPITMEFQVPMFTSSGLHILFMNIFERSGYKTIKWVRYVTRAGTYQIRI